MSLKKWESDGHPVDVQEIKKIKLGITNSTIKNFYAVGAKYFIYHKGTLTPFGVGNEVANEVEQEFVRFVTIAEALGLG